MSRQRKKPQRSGAAVQHELDRNRGVWKRKPMTQVVINKKAEQRRTMCRKKGTTDGAVVVYAAV